MQNCLIQSLKSLTVLTGLAAIMVMVPKPAMAQCDPYDAYCNLGITSAAVSPSHVSTTRRARPAPSIPPAQCPRGTRSTNDGNCLVVSSSQRPPAIISHPQTVRQTVRSPQMVSRPQLMNPPQIATRPQVMGSLQTVSRPQVMRAPAPQFAAPASEYQRCPEGTVQQSDKSCHVERVEIESKLTQALAKAPMMSGQPVYNADGSVAGTVIIMTSPTGSISVPGAAFPRGNSSP